ncbi:MAG TPA: MarR family winged helix-turn-helix transcriptional regulator [Acidobacteriaceae bacterium]|nr:MarR family winged helix-turn-helix transcriptional regulator [Acidobacteriaceae bacterium]
MKSTSRKEKPGPPAPRGSFGAAFLLAQLGSHAARSFAERLARLRLIPAHSGILYLVDATPGLTQQALANRLGMVPSRLVALLDELEALGLTQRRVSAGDRRRHELVLTEKGKKTLTAIGDVSREHQRALLAALTDQDREHLATLLQRIADQQGLIRNVHPGYKTLRPARSPTGS